ncbi:ras guanine nucleotide exchange factor domain-containing protein, partial [Melanogaster broomeanus]
KPAISGNDLFAWDPDDVAEQFCVLMHDLYAGIGLQECHNWVKTRTGTDRDVTSLGRFFDVHDRVTLWVQKSTLSYDNLAKRTEALDFWIRVAEKCQALHNFDTVSAIMSGLSDVALSLLRSSWARCTRKQIFDMLLRAYGPADNFADLMVVMDTAEGPSVPFVRAYLESIREMGRGPFDEVSPNSDYKATTERRRISDTLSTMLRHQSLLYGFGVTKSTRRFIDEQLSAVGSLTCSWLQARGRDIRQTEL